MVIDSLKGCKLELVGRTRLDRKWVGRSMLDMERVGMTTVGMWRVGMRMVGMRMAGMRMVGMRMVGSLVWGILGRLLLFGLVVMCSRHLGLDDLMWSRKFSILQVSFFKVNHLPKNLQD